MSQKRNGIRSLSAAAITTLATLLAPGSGHAVAVFEFNQVGTDLVGVLSGSLDLNGAVQRLNGQAAPVYGASLAHFDEIYFVVQASDSATLDPRGYYWLIDPPAANPASSSTVSIASGQVALPGIFELNVDRGRGGLSYVVAASDYQSGSPLSQTLTFANASFDSLRLVPGDYVYTLRGSNDTLTLSFNSVAAVPEPQAYLMMLLGLGVVAGVARRRRNA